MGDPRVLEGWVEPDAFLPLTPPNGPFLARLDVIFFIIRVKLCPLRRSPGSAWCLVRTSLTYRVPMEF